MNEFWLVALDINETRRKKLIINSNLFPFFFYLESIKKFTFKNKLSNKKKTKTKKNVHIYMTKIIRNIYISRYKKKC